MSEVKVGRDARIGRAFAQFTGSLVNGFDVVELLEDLAHTCVDLLGASAAGLMLSDQRGRLQVMGASSEEAWLLEVLEAQNHQGPCLDCHRSGEPLTVLAEDELARRWPVIAAVLAQRGLGVAYAFPLRLRAETIGALSIFRPVGQPLPDGDADIAQALADVATIAIVQHRRLHADEELAEQLQVALDGRVTLEQAKGVIAQYADTDMRRAFGLLREYSRGQQLPLTSVAAAVASGQLAPASIAEAGGPTHPPVA